MTGLLFRLRVREVFVVRENRIRVRLDEIELVFGCQAQIDSRVAVDCQQSVNLFTFLVDTNDKRRIEARRNGSPSPSVCDIRRPISPCR